MTAAARRPSFFAPPTLRISTAHTGTTVRIIASGEIDLATVSLLRRHLFFHLGSRAEIVVIDLTGITFIDSSGLHALLQAVETDRDRLRIAPSPACARLFDLVGIRDRLPLIDTNSN